jgi:DNA-binding transcriptional MerR regulator
MKKSLPLETGNVARRLNMSDDNVRKLERKGLLHAERTASGTRLFDADEVRRVAQARAEQKRNKK